jgi:hypothetical protein
MVLSPSPPAKPVAGGALSRTLAYQQAITQPREPKNADDASKADVPPSKPATSEPQAAAADPSAVPDLPPEDGTDTSQGVAALPDESADTQDGWPGQDTDSSEDIAAVPGGRPAPYDGVPPVPGEAGPGQDQWGTDGDEQWGDERGEPWAYGRPRQGDPYGPPPQADPYGPPDKGDPYGAQDQADQWGGQDTTEWADQNTEEWVEVIISGAAMRATASEDAPMLFAFPYGRNLKVISRYEGWVEVTDPKSAATGWMQAHVLAPSAANRQPYAQNEAYYDEPRGRRAGWFKHGGGLADMINRALGGGF